MVFELKSFIQQLPQKPGVYKMFDQDGNHLYIGKAANLKNRVSSYFRSRGLDAKTVMLVSRIAQIEITLTHSEAEALLLEQTLIKEYLPPFNVLMRDDKSYPYIIVSTQHEYPSLKSVRENPRKSLSKTEGRFYGPFPSVLAVNASILWLQKTFLIRNCDEGFFKNRSRPCLQHQIKRCSAPCVNQVEPSEYRANVDRACLFLEGKNRVLLEDLQAEMEQASAQLDFEKAGQIRDQISSLRQVQEQQHVHHAEGDVEVITVGQHQGLIGFYVLSVRQGKVLGGHSFFPNLADGIVSDSLEDALKAYIVQNYLDQDNDIPRTLVLSHEINDLDELQRIWQGVNGQALQCICAPRGARKGWLALAKTNLQYALQQKLSSKASQDARMQALQQWLDLPHPPKRIECFDISHTFGQDPVAACVVFVDGKPASKEYRRFNIKTGKGSDDYASIQEAVMRRYQRIQAEEFPKPDVLFIDGGKGQVKSAIEGLEQAGFTEDLCVIGVAKGPLRKAGWETLILAGEKSEATLDDRDPALHLIQQVRDEAHRFAITGHRLRRGKALIKSSLDDIPGVGAKRRQALLRYFGSVKSLKSASVSEIAKVKGISESLASTIYQHYHPDSG